MAIMSWIRVRFIDENKIKQLMTCKWYEREKMELMSASQLPQSKQLKKLIKDI
jgi:hypothetical protein